MGVFSAHSCIRPAGDSPTGRTGGAIFFLPDRGKLVNSGGLQVKYLDPVPRPGTGMYLWNGT
jgi:hypothetical protein